MTSLKQIRANKMNSKKSTGPRTSEGKARSARNALTHGISSAAPVLPGVERPEDWERHCAGALESLSPVGYIEQRLAERIALTMWRLERIPRFEVESAAEIQNACADEAEAEFEMSHPALETNFDFDPDAELKSRRLHVAWQRSFIEFLERFQCMGDRETLEYGDYVNTVLFASADLPKGRSERDDPFDLGRCKRLTAGLLRRKLGAKAVSSGYLTEPDADAVCDLLLVEARKSMNFMLERIRKLESKISQARQKSLLPEERTLQKITRYETHLHRIFQRDLHELQRLQDRRLGRPSFPPAALDVTIKAEAGIADPHSPTNGSAPLENGFVLQNGRNRGLN